MRPERPQRPGLNKDLLSAMPTNALALSPLRRRWIRRTNKLSVLVGVVNLVMRNHPTCIIAQSSDAFVGVARLDFGGPFPKRTVASEMRDGS